MEDNAKKVVQSQLEMASAKPFGIQNRVFAGVGVVGLPPTGLPESQRFVETSRRRIRLSHFEENGATVRVLSLHQQSVYQFFPDSHPAERRSDDDILEFPVGRHMPRNEKTGEI